MCVILQIEQFSIQILVQEVTIDVCGLFNLDYEILYSVGIY